MAANMAEHGNYVIKAGTVYDHVKVCHGQPTEKLFVFIPKTYMYRGVPGTK